MGQVVVRAEQTHAGVARPEVRPRRRFGAAFLLPLLALVWAAPVGHGVPATGADLFVVACLCGAAGVAWQLLHRRDVVDRLTHFVAGFTVVAILFFVAAAWDSTVTSSIGFGVGLCAVASGCVYAEQWLRWSDRRVAGTSTPDPHGRRSRLAGNLRKLHG